MKTLYSVLKQQKKEVTEAVSKIKGANAGLLGGGTSTLPLDLYDLSYKEIIVLHGCEVDVFSEHCKTDKTDKIGDKKYFIVPKWTIHLEEVTSLLNWNGGKPETNTELALLIDAIDEETLVSYDSNNILAIGDTILNQEVLWKEIISHFKMKAGDPLWHARELKRLDDLTYKPLPAQALKLLTQEQQEIVRSYFPHISLKDERLLSYTQSPEKGELDIQTPIKPGKFLSKVLPDADNELVKSFAAVFSSTKGLRLVVEKSPEAFSYAYLNLKNSGSCMDARNSFSECVVNGKVVHPATVYYNKCNDLHILYAINHEGTVIARCIGRADEMTHTRVYFDKNIPASCNKMHLLLKDSGWKEGEECLLGAVISKITTDHGRILCPYIDPYNAGVDVYDDHLVIGGGVKANVDSGLLKYEEFVAYCDSCGEGIEEDEETYHTYEGETICESCCTNRYTAAFDLREMHYTYVSDGSSHIFTFSGMMKLPYGNKLYDGDKVVEVQACSELVHLDSDHYAPGMVAPFEDCYVNSLGRGVLAEDMDKFDLFYNYEVGDICEISRWAIIDGQLTEIWPGYDLDGYELDFSSAGEDYPMLACYTSK